MLRSGWDETGLPIAVEVVFPWVVALRFFETVVCERSGLSGAFASALNHVKTCVCRSQRELESLFDRYDEDCSNTIDYKSLCDHLFEMGEHIAMNSTSRSMIERVSEYFQQHPPSGAACVLLFWARFTQAILQEQAQVVCSRNPCICVTYQYTRRTSCLKFETPVLGSTRRQHNPNENKLVQFLRCHVCSNQFKAQIFERGGVSGLRVLREHLESMDTEGSGLLERSQLTQGLANFGIDVDDGPGGDIEKIMGFFDRDVVGRIIIREFHRGLRVR